MPTFLFADGQHNVLDGYITLRECGEGSYLLDRIEVPESLRCTGLMGKIISLLVNECDLQGVELTALISPDSDDDEIAEGMIRVFTRHGFLPLVIDGETYRKDVTYTPKKLEI